MQLQLYVKDQEKTRTLFRAISPKLALAIKGLYPFVIVSFINDCPFTDIKSHKTQT